MRDGENFIALWSLNKINQFDLCFSVVMWSNAGQNGVERAIAIITDGTYVYDIIFGD